MKNLFLSFSIVLFLILYSIFLTPAAYAAGASLSLSPTSGNFNKGCNFSVDIKLDAAGTQTDGTDAIIFYDPTRLTANTIRSGTIYADYPGNSIDSVTGKITVSGLAPAGSAFSSAGVLASVDFTVVADAPVGVTQVKFDFDPADKGKTTDSNVVERGTVSDVLGQVVDATFTIGTGTCAAGGGKIISPTPVGRGGTATGSGQIIVVKPTKTIDDFTGGGTGSGSVEATIAVAVVGSLLTLAGIFGLAKL